MPCRSGRDDGYLAIAACQRARRPDRQMVGAYRTNTIIYGPVYQIVLIARSNLPITPIILIDFRSLFVDLVELGVIMVHEWRFPHFWQIIVLIATAIQGITPDPQDLASLKLLEIIPSDRSV